MATSSSRLLLHSGKTTKSNKVQGLTPTATLGHSSSLNPSMSRETDTLIVAGLGTWQPWSWWGVILTQNTWAKKRVGVGKAQEKSEYWTGKPQTAMQQPRCTAGPLSWLVLAQEG